MSAIVTPMRDDGRVDEDALRALVNAQLDAGMDAIVPCGTTGETPTLTDDEYRLVVRATVSEVNGRVPVIAGTGSNSTRKTVEFTRTAKELGVDAALVVTPYYNKPGQGMMYNHFRSVATDGGLPVVLYNVPGRTGVNMSADTTIALSKLDAVIAIKEASGDLSQVQAILAGTDERSFTLVSGDDALSLPMYAVGSHGVISVAGNIVPKAVKSVRTSFLAGDVSGAATQARRLFPLYEALFVESNPVPCKVALHLLGRMSPTVRAPLGTASDNTVTKITQVLTGLGLL